MSERRAPRRARVVAALLRKEAARRVANASSRSRRWRCSASRPTCCFHFGLQRGHARGQPRERRAVGDAATSPRCSGINRLFVADDEQGGFDAFLLSPGRPQARCCSARRWRCSATCVARRGGDGARRSRCCCSGVGIGQTLPGLLAVLALADLGVAVIGTLVGALAVRTRARDLLGPLLVAAAAGAGGDRRGPRDAPLFSAPWRRCRLRWL